MRSRLFIPIICLTLSACNFPTPQTSPGAPLAPSQTTAPGNHPAATGTQTAPAFTPTATPTPIPTSGPIAHLSAGSALAISRIDMIDADKGWAIGGAADAQLKDHVLRTENGGSTWIDVTPPEKTVVQPATDRIAVGGFWDSENALVTFYSANLLPPPAAPVVWKTTDGGAQWTSSAPLDLSGWVGEYRVSDLFLINIQTGWVLAHKGDDPKADRIALFQTVNGGNTWTRVIDPAVDGPVQDCEKTGILFTGPWNGWMTGDCLGERAGVFLYQTLDGGKSWIEAKLPSPASPAGMLTTKDFHCRINPPVFFAQDTNLLLGVECRSSNTQDPAANLFASNLDGSDWHIMKYPGGTLVIRSPGDGRVFRGDVGSGLAVGKDIYAYDGATQTWTLWGTVEWTGQFDFIDWNRGWAAARQGDAALFMHTSDGGKTWKPLTPTVAA